MSFRARRGVALLALGCALAALTVPAAASAGPRHHRHHHRRPPDCGGAFAWVRAGGGLVNSPLSTGQCSAAAGTRIAAALPGLVTLQGSSPWIAPTYRALAILPDSWLAFLRDHQIAITISTAPDPVEGKGGYFLSSASGGQIFVSVADGEFSAGVYHEVMHAIDWAEDWRDEPPVLVAQQQLAPGPNDEWQGDGFDPGRGELLADAIACYLTGGRDATDYYYGAAFTAWVGALLSRAPGPL